MGERMSLPLYINLLFGTRAFSCVSAALVVLISTAPACDSPPIPQSAGESDELPVETMDSRFQVVDRLSLEENDQVINVMPIVHIEPDGDVLVADPREAQVRWYDGRGGLRAAFGRRGYGPGEFQFPVTLRRLPDGRFFVADVTGGGITLVDEQLVESPDFMRVPLFPLYGAIPLDPARLLLMGREQEAREPRLLHVWSLSDRQIDRSLFPVPVPPELKGVALSLGSVAAAVRGDTIAAVFSVSDTVFLFGLRHGEQDRPLQRIPVPATAFSVSPPAPEAMTDARARTEWLRTITTLTGLYWQEDGSFIIQTARIHGLETEWGLVGMSRSGEKLFEIPSGPRLLGIRGDHYYLMDPESELPNEWIIAERTDF